MGAIRKGIFLLFLSVSILFISAYYINADQAVWSFNQSNLHRIKIVWQEQNDSSGLWEGWGKYPGLPTMKIFP
ncbi:MAG: hypothetical protein D5R97_08290 [Candidatus Syntrophonatronum acetioxidans]|uniref:Uncharacterized protein n=1 Tax=Candidatus Syntrophonatronum acetioxidans TaxID=1795816 RepID=A0A424YBK1_9FIRM|nr:MAG: hypothetical protein D5R97_08290 [Candidatus Syntrophonatronum acetioxidans]